MGDVISLSKPPGNNKLIFLDIDGVLNNGASDMTKMYVMEIELLKRLHYLIQETNVSLVLSSTWRYTEVYRTKLNDYFSNAKIPQVISCTPNLGTNRVDEILWWLVKNSNFSKKSSDDDTCKETNWVDIEKNLIEIESKFPEDLPNHLYQLPSPLTGVTHFIVIDDMNLANEKSNFFHLMEPHFVHIDKKLGLTDKDVEMAIKLLNDDNLKSFDAPILSETKPFYTTFWENLTNPQQQD